MCGVSPVERSSGSRQYRRLNRGGDRRANAALYRIVQPTAPVRCTYPQLLRAAHRGG
ncbi:IS110 family transposase [Streptomyces lydicamycinicus]|uniref:IS110 family transposase n=1 Tax=Streptomyces lydicamycinicus TaxID=1546107 RepID=UPI0020354FE3|nr:IS110 family transposase [Streptomyces lydicamycinicus]USA05465.1 IS110 family transposase [Streptomyces lydicamycinicus]